MGIHASIFADMHRCMCAHIYMHVYNVLFGICHCVIFRSVVITTKGNKSIVHIHNRTEVKMNDTILLKYLFTSFTFECLVYEVLHVYHNQLPVTVTAMITSYKDAPKEVCLLFNRIILFCILF